MRALLVHPRTPPTYWGFQHSLPIAGKAASLPPLGLLSLAPLLPRSWEIRVLDENVESVTDGAGTLAAYYMLCEAEGLPRPNVLVD